VSEADAFSCGSFAHNRGEAEAERRSALPRCASGWFTQDGVVPSEGCTRGRRCVERSKREGMRSMRMHALPAPGGVQREEGGERAHLLVRARLPPGGPLIGEGGPANSDHHSTSTVESSPSASDCSPSTMLSFDP